MGDLGLNDKNGLRRHQCQRIKIMDDIKHFMSNSSLSVDSKATVLETIKLMRDKKVGSLLVTENGDFVGIFTETALLRKVAAEEGSPEKTQVSSVMSSPLLSIDGNKSMVTAFLMMQQKNIRHLGVLDNNKITGVISIRDMIPFRISFTILRNRWSRLVTKNSPMFRLLGIASTKIVYR